MKLERVYEDHNGLQVENRRSICCIVNEPGYLTKFELHYRSTQSNGQWIKLGLFDGNSNYHESIKVVLDEPVIAKELRLIPVSYEKSFDKVVVMPFTTIVPDETSAIDATVKYMIDIPRFIGDEYIYVPDVISERWKNGIWKHEKPNTKGEYKKRRRDFLDNVNA